MSENNTNSQAEMHAALLSKALPYMQRYDQKFVVVKFGGHAMGNPETAEAFARDIVLLRQAGVHPIVVHGGGPQIGAMLKELNIKSEFKDGLRVTDAKTVEIVEMVLAGLINKQIVSAITKQGGRAIGLCGKDANMMTAKKLLRTKIDPDSNIEKTLDLGFVGEPNEVNPGILKRLTSEEIIPVIAPVAASNDGQTYNINGDTFAGALAGALNAKRLLLLTDVAGILDGEGKLIEEIDATSAKALITSGVASGGMIPKIETCVEAIDNGVEGVVIINGKIPHSVLLELFTEYGSGTLIR